MALQQDLTIIAASRWLKNKHYYKNLIIAVPVAPARDKSTIDNINEIADRVIILHTVEEFFGVGQFYKNFNQVSDQDVKEIMKEYGYNTR